MRGRSWRVAVALVATVAVGCEERGEYAVTVRLPGDVGRAARVEVAVIPSCDDVVHLGDEPVSALHVVDAPGGRALGTVALGRHGLYARAWDAGCILYAAGCKPFVAEAGAQGTIAVDLLEIDARGCSPGSDCVDGRCGPGDEDGGPDAGSEGWSFVDDSDQDFGAGETGVTTIVSSGSVLMRAEEARGEFTSRSFEAPAEGVVRSMSWQTPAPYGLGLRAASAGDAELGDYAEDGFDVSGLVLLYHLDGAPAPLRDGELVPDASGHGHDAEVVDLGSPGTSMFHEGRVGGGAFLERDDYLRIADALVHEDFELGTDDFTWAAWVRIDGCEASQSNVIALGGEDPHIWLGAQCPQGFAHWQAHDDDNVGDGIDSPDVIVDAEWHHLVGVKTVDRMLLYLDGRLAATHDEPYGTFGNFTQGLLLGNFPIGDPPAYTYASELDVDEVAILRRALSGDEVRSLYRRGALRLHLQVRACPASGCVAEPFVGPDGTTATSFLALDDPESAIPVVEPTAEIGGRIFQYVAVFESDIPGTSPFLERVQMLIGPP